MSTTSSGGGFILVCRTLNIDSIELAVGPAHLASSSATNETPTELLLPLDVGRVEVKGFEAGALVARAFAPLAGI